jgi:hypothetical protein
MPSYFLVTHSFQVLCNRTEKEKLISIQVPSKMGQIHFDVISKTAVAPFL